MILQLEAHGYLKSFILLRNQVWDKCTYGKSQKHAASYSPGFCTLVNVDSVLSAGLLAGSAYDKADGNTNVLVSRGMSTHMQPYNVNDWSSRKIRPTTPS